MDKVCRLCCSTEYVSNYIFDEETGLYLKMSLYLPIRVIKNDRLPQMICDPCSCKVNYFYQFCNEAIEAQNRLQLSLATEDKDGIPEDSNLTIIKHNLDSPPQYPPNSPPHSPAHYPPHSPTHYAPHSPTQYSPHSPTQYPPHPPPHSPTHYPPHSPTQYSPHSPTHFPPHPPPHSPPHSPQCPPHLPATEPKAFYDQSTQTDFEDFKLTPDKAMAIKVKSEPNDVGIQCHSTPSPVIMEYTDLPTYHNSDSDDTVLINLQKKKRKSDTKKLKKVKFSEPKKRVKQEERKKRIKKEIEAVVKPPEGPIVFNNDTPLELRLNMMADEDFIEDSVEKKPKLKEKRDYFCCVCLKECKSKNLMLMHYDKHVNDYVKPAEFVQPMMPEERPLKCNRCYAVMEEADWVEHWARHWEKDHRPLRCALCPSSMQSSKGALEHSLKHTSEEVAAATAADSDIITHFGCDLCEASYKTKRELMTHRTLSHPGALGGPLLLRCSVCARTFNRASSHYRHMQVHRSVREHLCNVCGKALSSREHLKSHIKIHTGQKPHECKTCGKAFKEKYHLTVHERSHTGTKPYVCPTCGRGFSQKSPLVIHMRSHTGERPYVCKLCGRGFVSQGLLTMHHKTTCI